MDMASTQWADFLDELHALMNTDQPSQERLDAIECYLCSELYEKLFAPSVDKAQDEILQSRVAALNLLDLDMGHLGVTVQTEDQQAVDDMIQSAGKQLQQLNSLFTAKGKLESLVKTHQGIVDAIEALAVKEKGESSGSDVDVVQEIHMAMTSAQEEETSKHHEIKVNASPADAPDTSNSTNENDSGQEDKDTTRLGTASADVLLPLLIYTIVKTNPTNFISNLKFTQRFRRPSQLTGMASYCVTNITAAVTFLETTNLVGLGLSADKVHSNVTDLNALPQSSGAKQPSAPSPSATTSGGLRLVSEVMDSSYKMFDGIGRFWQRSGDAVALNAKLGDTGTTSQGGASSSVSGSHARSPPRLFSTSELKEMTASALTSFTKKEAPAPANADASTSNTSSQWDSAIPGFMEQRKTAPKPPSTKSDPLQALLQAPSQLMHSIQSRPASNAQPAHDQPIQKFLDIKSVNDLTIGDITELLADYKRLAAILKQSNAIP
ncbi:hypothetical protein BC940DRAFT_62320 [Gongronella butleri]|nr:hypothetical protein BC940DRAFT_62320 [Gongronella butleri]